MAEAGCAEGGRPEPPAQIAGPGGHAVAALVTAVIGVAPKAVVELRPELVDAQPEVHLGHGELVQVGRQRSDAIHPPSLAVFVGERPLLGAFRLPGCSSSGLAAGVGDQSVDG